MSWGVCRKGSARSFCCTSWKRRTRPKSRRSPVSAGPRSKCICFELCVQSERDCGDWNESRAISFVFGRRFEFGARGKYTRDGAARGRMPALLRTSETTGDQSRFVPRVGEKLGGSLVFLPSRRSGCWAARARMGRCGRGMCFGCSSDSGNPRIPPAAGEGCVRAAVHRAPVCGATRALRANGGGADGRSGGNADDGRARSSRPGCGGRGQGRCYCGAGRQGIGGPVGSSFPCGFRQETRLPMKQLLAIVAGAVLAVGELGAQTAGMRSAFQQIGWMATHEYRFDVLHMNRPDGQTGPVHGKPFSGTEVRHVIQTLVDGTHVDQMETTASYRDAQGRMRAENRDRVLIYDPVSGFVYNLDPRTKTYRKTPISDRTSSATIAATASGTWVATDDSHPPAYGDVSARRGIMHSGPPPVTEDLRREVINGITCNEARMTN